MPSSIAFHTYGGPEVLSIQEQLESTCPAGHIRVKIEYAGVNYIDIYKRTGAYPSQLPCIPGQEFAGTVTEVGVEQGENVPFKVGDRVVSTSATGGYAQSAVVPWRSAVTIPSSVSTEIACSLMLQGLTAHYLACSTFPLKPLDTCVVHAAAGGVGLLLIQIAKMRGAIVIGITSTPEKAELARRAGADHVIVRSRSYTTESAAGSVVQKIKDLTSGRGVDVVYDSVGHDTFASSLDSLRPRGMLVLYGQSSGAVAPIDPQILSAKGSLFLTRPSLAHYVTPYNELLTRSQELFSQVEENRLGVAIFKIFPLHEAALAHTLLESRDTSGKILLDCRS